MTLRKNKVWYDELVSRGLLQSAMGQRYKSYSDADERAFDRYVLENQERVSISKKAETQAAIRMKSGRND